MSLKNFTTIFETVVSAISTVGAEVFFIHGGEDLQNLLADKLEIYPCVFLDSPRVGTAIINQAGSMMVGYNIRFAVLDKMGVDEFADLQRAKLQEMGAIALTVLAKVVGTIRITKPVVANWSEWEGVFDAHLTGWMIDFVIEEPATDYLIC